MWQTDALKFSDSAETRDISPLHVYLDNAMGLVSVHDLRGECLIDPMEKSEVDSLQNKGRTYAPMLWRRFRWLVLMCVVGDALLTKK